MWPSSQTDPPPRDIHAAFTRAERMQQLADIDHDIASLLELTGTAIQSLGKQSKAPPPRTANANGPTARIQSAEKQTQAFQEAMNKFLSTLHSVDARLKRQILGLDEAGIITLPNNKDNIKERSKEDEPNSSPRPALEPNGVGMVGDLDVGWLNSRSNQVEREMEAELWSMARRHLETLTAGVTGASGGANANMAE